MSMYLEWSTRVSGLSGGSLSIAGGLSGLSVVAQGLLPEEKLVSVGKDFGSLIKKLEGGSYTEVNWEQSEEWKRIKEAVEAERQFRLKRDAKLTSVVKQTEGLAKDLRQEKKERDGAIASAVRESEFKIEGKIEGSVSNLYTVKTFQEGTLISGRISSSARNSSGGAVIRHTAVVRNLAGTAVTESKKSGLQWKVNKGRKSAPLERVVPGAQCDISESDLVKEAGVPAYYDIELYRNF